MPGYNTDTYAGFRHHYTLTTESAAIIPPLTQHRLDSDRLRIYYQCQWYSIVLFRLKTSPESKE